MSYILLVEDNEATASIIIRALSAAGYEVRHFLKGLPGIQEARRETPSLVLMDFDLPDVDGRTLVLQLKKRFGRAGPPIVAVTARSDDIERKLAQRFGADAFVAKPFDPEQLVALVATLLHPTEP